MHKYNVTAYLETKCSLDGMTDTNYILYGLENTTEFFGYFSEPEYYNFYFTSYPFVNKNDITHFPGQFYGQQLSPYTIEGRGGTETERTREQIHLRQIVKQPDKSIQSFFSALQRKLKNIPGLQKEAKGLVNLYYLPAAKIIIPPHPHSNKVIGSWEEYFLMSTVKNK